MRLGAVLLWALGCTAAAPAETAGSAAGGQATDHGNDSAGASGAIAMATAGQPATGGGGSGAPASSNLGGGGGAGGAGAGGEASQAGAVGFGGFAPVLPPVPDAQSELPIASPGGNSQVEGNLRYVVTGASAGGHLALMVGMATPAAGFGPTNPADYRIAAIVNGYGPTDIPDLLQRGTSFAKQWLPAGAPNRDELAARLSPVSYVRKDMPPLLNVPAAVFPPPAPR